ncbi:MAG TPA: hypothetical protein PLL56_14145 [Verrucomicrobiota bacterium]|nr:hypothetical protein [Verrucomicrobiota bacterium]
MTITGLLRNKSDLPPAAAPTSVRTVSVPAGCGTGEVYRDGCLLHAALAGDGNVEFAAVVDAIRREVHTCGGKFIRTEQLYAAWCDTPRGRADIVATGPKGRTGLIEVKVVKELPDHPRDRDAVQLGGYVQLQFHWTSQLRQGWAMLVYVDLAAGRMRVYGYDGRELRQLVRNAGLCCLAA